MAMDRYLYGDKALLDADRERELARRIESHRVQIWELALSGYEPAAGFVRAWLGARVVGDELEDICVERALDIVRVDTNRRHERALRAELRSIAAIGLTRDGSVPGNIRVGRAFEQYRVRIEAAAERATVAWHELVESNVRLAISVATSVPDHGIDRDDLIQEAILGLMRAADRFDYRHGCRFSTYATWWIRHRVGRAISNMSRMVRVPSHIYELRQRARKVRRALEERQCGPVSDDDVSSELGIDVSKLRRAEGHLAAQTVSFDALLDDGESPSRRDGYDVTEDAGAGAVDARAFEHISAVELGARLSELSEMEESILRRRFAIGTDSEHTLAEIGEQHGLSRERIRQIQNRAIAKLRRAYGLSSPGAPAGAH